MKEAVLFTKTVCPKCMLVKSAIDNTENDIVFTFKNIDEDSVAKEELVSNNFSAVPILKINGEYVTDVSKMLGILNNSEQ